MNRQTKLAVAAIMIIIPLSIVGVYSTSIDSPTIDESSDSKLKVIASFDPLYRFSKIVGGDLVDVTLLVPVGVEPHDWEPTVNDVREINASDLIVINGIGFETWVDDLYINNYQGRIIDTSIGIFNDEEKGHTDEERHDEEHEEGHTDEERHDEEHEEGHTDEERHDEEHEEGHTDEERHDEEHEEGHTDEERHDEEHEEGHTDEERHDEEHEEGHTDEERHDEEHEEGHTDEERHDEEHEEGHVHESGDPHIWLNPVYAKIQIQNIADAFSESDPQNREYYQKNAVAYIQKLDQLDLQIRDELSGCKTDFIAFHNAFSYFANEYGLTQHTIVSSSGSHGEVTAKTLQDVISTAKSLDIKIIFSEENVSSRTSEIIADEIGGDVLLLSPLEITNTEDDNDDDDADYISRMTTNLENLRVALCQ